MKGTAITPAQSEATEDNTNPLNNIENNEVFGDWDKGAEDDFGGLVLAHTAEWKGWLEDGNGVGCDGLCERARVT